MKKFLLYFLLPAFVVLQIFQPERNTSIENFVTDIGNTHKMPDSIENIITSICYDCHSNNTEYPWFTNIQPIGWYVNNKVTHGKKNLNFSEFGKLTIELQAKKLDQVSEALTQKNMPPNSYMRYNKAANLTDAQRKMLSDWAIQLKAKILFLKDTSGTKSSSGYK